MSAISNLSSAPSSGWPVQSIWVNRGVQIGAILGGVISGIVFQNVWAAIAMYAAVITVAYCADFLTPAFAHQQEQPKERLISIQPRDAGYNRQIFLETMERSKQRYGKETEELIRQTEMIQNSQPIRKVNPQYKTEIFVMNCTTRQMLQLLVENGYNPLGLNMANAQEAGGGVRRGANAQEEILLRQSNCMPALLALEVAGKYPIPVSGGIYSPKVMFFRKDPQEDYADLERPFRADLFASAAFICGQPANGIAATRPQNDREYERLTKEKMRTMFRSAINHGNDSLVLCAFGCGAFRNDPKTIAKWYADVLADPEFEGHFKIVAFGIVGDHAGDNNFKVFKAQFPLMPESLSFVNQ